MTSCMKWFEYLARAKVQARFASWMVQVDFEATREILCAGERMSFEESMAEAACSAVRIISLPGATTRRERLAVSMAQLRSWYEGIVSLSVVDGVDGEAAAKMINWANPHWKGHKLTVEETLWTGMRPEEILETSKRAQHLNFAKESLGLLMAESSEEVTCGHLGCMLSHADIWCESTTCGMDWVMVVEDDAEPMVDWLDVWRSAAVTIRR
eukprot:gnl/MRDRNA2_/MRDRNA2_275187_c0_seq1.p1 gnl/MRDRNA2_/MRDRNA2_275187_c0~~gnl/MRDRNA2_/MRDRNA2_275187_c0_seq1.p1  ORF type:complete len:211 (+),score=49.77 gnl/MRDRNA2_/MRDRNA2_275187_c0_seq1:308-940(+)